MVKNWLVGNMGGLDGQLVVNIRMHSSPSYMGQLLVNLNSFHQHKLDYLNFMGLK